MQSSTNNETMFIICHVRIHGDFSSVIISLGPSSRRHLRGLNLVFDQREILKCNGHRPSFSCGKWPFKLTWSAEICVRPTYHLEAGLMKSSTNNETLFIVCHVRIHVQFSFTIIPLGSSLGRLVDQREILECNGRGPSVSRVGSSSFDYIADSRSLESQNRRVIFDFLEGMTLGWLPEGHCWAGDQS